jgi:hypothetical protein
MTTENSVRFLDRLLPVWHFNEFHSMALPADKGDVIARVQNVTWGQMPIAYWLMRLRSVPMRVLPKSGVTRDEVNRRAQFLTKDSNVFSILFETGEYGLLHSTDEEYTFGGYYPIKQEMKFPYDKSDPARAFLDSELGGVAKVVAAFAIQDGCIATETRVQVMDEADRRHFGAYWFFIRLGSGYIRKALLRAALK